MADLFTNIMLVEDDQDDKYLFFEAIKEIEPSIHCLWAKNGEEALTILKSAKGELLECIFLDINMPRMNGMECLSCIKTDNSLKHLPVIILSTAEDLTTQKAMKKAGANAYITKPQKLKKLVEILAFYLVSGNVDKLH